jgi:hypothetical protein
MEFAILAEYETTGRISAAALAQLTDESDESAEMGNQLYLHYRQQPNIAFARALLADLSARYVTAYTQGGPATTEGLRLAGYLIGLHQDVRDSLLLWRTKQLTFDTACEFDIQLVAFAGIKQTLAYLQSLPDLEAAEAVTYLQQCQAGGDFDTLEDYFSPDNLPYWLGDY